MTDSDFDNKFNDLQQSFREGEGKAVKTMKGVYSPKAAKNSGYALYEDMSGKQFKVTLVSDDQEFIDNYLTSMREDKNDKSLIVNEDMTVCKYLEKVMPEKPSPFKKKRNLKDFGSDPF